MRDPGKLGARRKAVGRERILKDGKLEKVGGRQMFRNLETGDVETERTITIRLPNGKFANVPSFNSRTGRDYKTEGAAYRGARDEGYTIKSYDTVAQAEAAAGAKSRRLGQELRKRGY